MEQIFCKEQLSKATFIIDSPLAKLSELYPSEIENLAIIWCYYSGKIEGNSYTYVETECLLKDGITSLKKFEDAENLINLHNTFTSKLKYIHKDKHQDSINEHTLYKIHQSISMELPSGKKDIQPKNQKEIINKILSGQEKYINPLEKAIYLHCNLAYLQPFISNNGEVARMVESIIMMNANLIPVYSFKDADVAAYRKAMFSFHKTRDYHEYAEYFLNKQVARIKEIEK